MGRKGVGSAVSLLLFRLRLLGFGFGPGYLFQLFFTAQVGFPAFSLNDLIVLFTHVCLGVVFIQTGGQAHLGSTRLIPADVGFHANNFIRSVG